MKILKLFLVFTVCLSFLTACTEVDTYDDGYEDGYIDGYSDGHYEGYEEGYEDGEIWGKDDLAFDYKELCTEEIQEAVYILLDYAEQGGEFTEADLEDAAWIMFYYYHDVCDLIGYEP